MSRDKRVQITRHNVIVQTHNLHSFERVDNIRSSIYYYSKKLVHTENITFIRAGNRVGARYRSVLHYVYDYV